MLGKDNVLVKDAAKLNIKKYRECTGLFIAEGTRFVEEAVKYGSVKYILYCNKNKIAFKECYEVSESVIKKICDTENPQGICAVVKKREWTVDDIKSDLIVIIDGVQDPGNLGTIIRTADAAGAGGVIIIKGTCDLYNSKTLRSTMGSIFHVPVFFYEDFETAYKNIKSIGYSIYAASLDTSNSLYECSFTDKTAIVIGNEGNGIPKDHLEMSDVKFKIPMPGMAESLNAAAACAVILFEAVRQRTSL